MLDKRFFDRVGEYDQYPPDKMIVDVRDLNFIMVRVPFRGSNSYFILGSNDSSEMPLERSYCYDQKGTKSSAPLALKMTVLPKDGIFLSDRPGLEFKDLSIQAHTTVEIFLTLLTNRQFPRAISLLKDYQINPIRWDIALRSCPQVVNGWELFGVKDRRDWKFIVKCCRLSNRLTIQSILDVVERYHTDVFRDAFYNSISLMFKDTCSTREFDDYVDRLRQVGDLLDFAEAPMTKVAKFLYRVDNSLYSHYVDYLRMRLQIKDVYDISKLPITPSDFGDSVVDAIRRNHDFVMNIFNKHQEEIQKRAILEQQEKYIKNVYPIASKFEFEFGDYVIIAPKELAELTTEGRALNHCVGSYIDSVSNGNEYILFLRKKNDPLVPFFTLDVTPDKQLRQAHGRNNSCLTKELTKVITAWCNEFKIKFDSSTASGLKIAIR